METINKTTIDKQKMAEWGFIHSEFYILQEQKDKTLENLLKMSMPVVLM